MKLKIHYLFILSIFSLITSSCTFELISDGDPASAEVDPLVTKAGGAVNGISEETLNSIPIDLGEIGVSIDTRTLAIYGYKPTKIRVDLGGELSAYSQQDIVVNEYTHVAVFKLKREDLTDAELKVFSNGVPLTITVTVYNDKGQELEEVKTISRYIINATARTLKIDPKLPRIIKPLEFDPEKDQYIQLATDYKFLSILSYTDFDDTNVALGNYNNRGFKIIKTSTFATDSTYHITKEVQPSCQCGRINVHLEADIFNYTDNDVAELFWSNDYEKTWYEPLDDKFVFEQTERGTVKIKPLGSDTYLSSNYDLFSNGYPDRGYTLFFDNNPTNDLEFNIFTANISWEFTNLGIKYSPAIIPPTKMDFAFQQTILNCSGATGDYEVGVTRSETTTTTMSYEESINLFSSKYDKKSTTIEVTAGGSFFGIGVEASGSGTLTTETETEFGKEKIANESKIYTASQEVSYNRKVTVLPYSAIEVFDVIQKLENIKIPFVQRYIIRGSVNQDYLSGSEIESQLIANAFNGVVTERGTDFIVISVRGAVNIENYFEFNNTLHDILGACN